MKRATHSRGIRPSPIAAKTGAHIRAKQFCWLCFLLAGSLFAPCVSAQELDEHAIRVAYVFNLTKYVEWPRAGNQLVVCFVGDGPMGEALEKMLAGKTSDSRLIRVVLSPSEEDFDQCDVAYVASSSSKKVHETLDHLRNKSVLTVGDNESFPKSGGMIALVRVGQQVQMIVNLDAVERARLKISSRVLNLATIVHDASAARN
jgi:YfiR/HmsC-like